jgi:hypothetical protein
MKNLLDRVRGTACSHCRHSPCQFYNNSSKSFLCGQCVALYALDENYLAEVLLFKNVELFGTQLAQEWQALQQAAREVVDSHLRAVTLLLKEVLRDGRTRHRFISQELARSISAIRLEGQTLELQFERVLAQGKLISRQYQQKQVEFKTLS